MKSHRPKLLFDYLLRASRVRQEEVGSCAISFFIIFLLMGSYYVLRPVRDALASDWTDAEVGFLWTMNFAISACAVAAYGWVVSRLPLKLLIPFMYGLFAASFGLFYLFIQQPGEQEYFAKAFYIWVSVYSLFNISIFWSFMADFYHQEQASRLFPIIGAGASTGALIGPSIPTLFTHWLGSFQLMLITALCIAFTIPLFIKLLSKKDTITKSGRTDRINDHCNIGGNPFRGFLDFIQNPFLRKIGVFIVLYTSISTFLYFEQKNMLAAYSLAERSQILGAVDWIVNILTFSIAFFATSRIVNRFGMPVALAMIPFLMCGGLLLLTITSSLLITLGLQVVRRAGNYALTKPAREMLFTQVTQEERFKSKPVIDIVVYRGGDMLTSWGVALLTEGLNLGLGAMAGIGSLIAGLWTVTGLRLGKTYETSGSRNDS